jgi:hypothetical protein
MTLVGQTEKKNESRVRISSSADELSPDNDVAGG